MQEECTKGAAFQKWTLFRLRDPGSGVCAWRHNVRKRCVGFCQVGKNIFYITGKWHRTVADSIFQKKVLSHFCSMCFSRTCHSSINMRILFPLHLKFGNPYECIDQWIASLLMLTNFWYQVMKADMISAWISHLGCLQPNLWVVRKPNTMRRYCFQRLQLQTTVASISTLRHISEHVFIRLSTPDSERHQITLNEAETSCSCWELPKVHIGEQNKCCFKPLIWEIDY